MSPEDALEAEAAAPASLDDLLDSDVDGLLDAPVKQAKVTHTDRLERAS